jgi:hypothetical protein
MPAMSAYSASPPAIPEPVAKPRRYPDANVRRMHGKLIGPTGAATAAPIAKPVTKIHPFQRRHGMLFPGAEASTERCRRW